MKISTTDLKKVEAMLSAYAEKNGAVSMKHQTSTNCSACFNSCYGSCGYNCVAVCRSTSK